MIRTHTIWCDWPKCWESFDLDNSSTPKTVAAARRAGWRIQFPLQTCAALCPRHAKESEYDSIRLSVEMEVACG